MSAPNPSALPWLHPDRTAKLYDALSQRILVIDGAMGTMLQSYKLDEAGYRGERFTDGRDTQHTHAAGETPWPRLRPQGRQRPADPDPAGDHSRRPHRLSGRRRRPDRDQYLQRDVDQPVRLSAGASDLRIESRGRTPGARVLRGRRAEDPAATAFRHRCARTDQPHCVDFPGCEQPGFPQTPASRNWR